MFCNNSYVFCGMEGGEVKVYSMTDGQWVRDLESGEEDLEVERICGGESIVAAQLGVRVVTVWKSKDDLGHLHSFDARNHDGLEDGCVGDVKVTGNKVVLLLVENTDSTHQRVSKTRRTRSLNFFPCHQSFQHTWLLATTGWLSQGG